MQHGIGEGHVCISNQPLLGIFSLSAPHLQPLVNAVVQLFVQAFPAHLSALNPLAPTMPPPPFANALHLRQCTHPASANAPPQNNLQLLVNANVELFDSTGVLGNTYTIKKGAKSIAFTPGAQQADGHNSRLVHRACAQLYNVVYDTHCCGAEAPARSTPYHLLPPLVPPSAAPAAARCWVMVKPLAASPAPGLALNLSEVTLYKPGASLPAKWAISDLRPYMSTTQGA